jgi:hypothetical protein
MMERSSSERDFTMRDAGGEMNDSTCAIRLFISREIAKIFTCEGMKEGRERGKRKEREEKEGEGRDGRVRLRNATSPRAGGETNGPTREIANFLTCEGMKEGERVERGGGRKWIGRFKERKKREREIESIRNAASPWVTNVLS